MLSTDSTRMSPTRYRGFPSFTEWAACKTDVRRWERAAADLRESEVCSDILRRIPLLIKDAASAYGGGGVSGEAKSDASVFMSMCESLISDRVTDTGSAIESQLWAYDHVMDFASGGKKISKSWLCRLHSLTCGPRQSPAADGRLGAGEYKRFANRIVRGDGAALRAAPVKRTSAEMAKYCRELRSRQFLEAHPVLQASYAHYALVAIHPFVDGNGRVARLLALGFIYRANSTPALPLNQDRAEYASSLREADLGDFQPFINLVREKSIESATQIKGRILSAMRRARA
jgi:prophage maintenance system killer protein